MEVAGSQRQRAPRIALASQVEVRFEEFDEFVTEVSRDVSLTGMFLATSRPHPPGSSFEFEIEVEGGQRLIHGLAEVVWVRPRNEAQDRPPGMGVRFVSLDEQSRRLIAWLIDRGLAAAETQPAPPG